MSMSSDEFSVQMIQDMVINVTVERGRNLLLWLHDGDSHGGDQKPAPLHDLAAKAAPFNHALQQHSLASRNT
jgi:hypothetical protein